MSHELGDAAFAVEYSFTHASFAPMGDALYLAAARVGGGVAVYSVR